MTESYSLPNRHFELDQCVNFLESKNSAAQLEHAAISRYKTLVSSGPDTELLRFQSSLQAHDVKKILIYLRSFDICDLADCERISNPHLFPTSELMVAELVTVISTKDPHAFWYFVHAVKKFRGRKGLFEFFHGNINCCVCEEVLAKEKEIDETLSLVLSLSEAKESIFCKLIFKIKFSVREDIKKEVKRLGTIAKGRLGEFRREVGQPLGKYYRSIVKKVFENYESMPLNEQRPSTDNGKVDVVISMPSDPLEKPKEDSAESPRYEDASEPAVPDEEAGYKRSFKPKRGGSALSKFDVVEGRKKFIAFLCVSCVTLYSYGVDSLIKLF